MKKFQILLVILITNLLYSKDLSISQRLILEKCRDYGKIYNLANTLAAICYVESKGGIYRINPDSQDYGITGINVNSALYRLKQKNTWHNKNVLATKLVLNDELSLSLAVLELLYWKNTRKRDYWASMIESYNKGNTFKKYKYANKVSKAIKYLKIQKILK